MNNKIDAIVFKFFGTTTKNPISDTFHIYETEDFLIYIQRRNNRTLISIDLHSCFNKTQQMPIHFVVENDKVPSKRKQKRIFEALRFLKKNEKEAGEFFHGMPGFEDLDSENLYSFLR